MQITNTIHFRNLRGETANNPENSLAMAFTVVMLAGIFQIIFGIFKLGKYIGAMIFGLSKAIAREHTAMKDHDVLILDLSDVPLLSITASLAIENAIKDAVEQGRQVFIVGASGKIKQRLEHLGILNVLPPQNLMMDRVEALRQAVALVKGLQKDTAHRQRFEQVNPNAPQAYQTDVNDTALP